uniref:Uncharacterized protein n=1 Tax=Candidatus Nitrotoga fabula TaxID=2182327 RepID=A0A2X0QYE1_9PROT|nr:protein of unknown function [Candidatus Nitrotoga fabula]
MNNGSLFVQENRVNRKMKKLRGKFFSVLGKRLDWVEIKYKFIQARTISRFSGVGSKPVQLVCNNERNEKRMGYDHD